MTTPTAPREQTQDPKGASSLPTVRSIGFVVLGILALIFVFQNSRDATLSVFLWDITMPGWIFLLLLLLAGIAIGSLFPWMRRRPKG